MLDKFPLSLRPFYTMPDPHSKVSEWLAYGMAVFCCIGGGGGGRGEGGGRPPCLGFASDSLLTKL
jgi:hypothetical protein